MLCSTLLQACCTVYPGRQAPCLISGGAWGRAPEEQRFLRHRDPSSSDGAPPHLPAPLPTSRAQRHAVAASSHWTSVWSAVDRRSFVRQFHTEALVHSAATGGRVRLASKPEQPSHFSFRLPPPPASKQRGCCRASGQGSLQARVSRGSRASGSPRVAPVAAAACGWAGCLQTASGQSSLQARVSLGSRAFDSPRVVPTAAAARA